MANLFTAKTDSTSMVHTVSVDNTYSGPLDLLLYLVRRDEIDIHDIPISHLTREYLAAFERMELVDVDAGGEFLAMASMLMEIKSRMLLPVVETEDGEETEDSFDPRAGLVKSLLEYKKFKEVAGELGKMAESHAERFARIAPLPQFPAHLRDESEKIGALDLFAAFQKIARKMVNKSAPREIVNEEIPTEVRIEQIQMVIAQSGRASFTGLLSDSPTEDEMVGFFIAILELVRLKKIRAQQSLDFSEIYFFAYDSEVEEVTVEIAEKAVEAVSVKIQVIAPFKMSLIMPRLTNAVVGKQPEFKGDFLSLKRTTSKLVLETAKPFPPLHIFHTPSVQEVAVEDEEEGLIEEVECEVLERQCVEEVGAVEEVERLTGLPVRRIAPAFSSPFGVTNHQVSMVESQKPADFLQLKRGVGIREVSEIKTRFAKIF